MRLLLADDHTLFRDAVAQYITRSEPDTEILVARDVHDVMEMIDAHDDIALILLDLRMPGMDGMQGLKKIRELHPDMPVAILSGSAEEKDIRHAMSLGARGYFPKTLSGQVLLSGIRRIVAGDNFVAMDHNTNSYMPAYYEGEKSAVEDTGAATAADKRFKLTPRESQVLQYLARGVSNKEIARALDLQIVTVKLHVRGVCRKLDVQNRTQAALKAREMGLVAADG